MSGYTIEIFVTLHRLFIYDQPSSDILSNVTNYTITIITHAYNVNISCVNTTISFKNIYL